MRIVPPAVMPLARFAVPLTAKVAPVLLPTFGGFATVAVLVAAQDAGASLWLVNAAMLVPAVVTAIAVPTSRRRWYRWVAILALAQVINPWATAPYLLVATSWALWRSWYVERADSVPAPTARKVHGAAHQDTVKKLKKVAA